MRFLLAGFVFVGALTVTGCNTEVARVTLKGKVTLDDKLVENGLVEFEPIDGKTPTAKDGRIINGEYTAQVVPGEVIVRITSSEVVGKKKMYDTPDSPLVDDVKERIPKKYNEESTLREKIEPGRKALDFKLTSK